MAISPELVARFEQLLAQSRKALIASHMNPDGDAFGSSLAMSHFLDQRRVEHEVLNHDPKAPFNLKFLPGVDRVRKTPSEDGADLAIVLDLDNLKRLGDDIRDFIEPCDQMVLIDHHIPHEAPGDLRMVDVQASATSLILYRLFKAMKVNWTPEMATCLLAGIFTDTGGFRYNNTTAEALEASAELLAAGGQLLQVAEESYMRKPLAVTRLLGRTLNIMRLEENNQIAFASLDRRDFEECGALEEHAEGLANELLSIETVQIAAVLRHPPERKMRASLRSRGPYDVASVARKFEGGGHKNAAGCTFETNLRQAEDDLLRELKACLASSS